MTLDELLEWQPYKVFEMDSWLMARQEDCGIGFDIEGAKALVERIDREMTEIASEIEPQLPPRPLNKGEIDSWRIPAKPWKKDGTLASSMVKWMERVGAKLHTERDILLDGEVYPIVGGQPTKTHGPMRLSNQDDLKNFLMTQGWEPTLFNFKRDERGKPARDERGQVIFTTPKLQENGKLCPNLEEMAGELVRPVVRWASLRNRKSVLEGWLEDKRLPFDGRLSAGSSGITPSFRQRHVKIVNLPKPDATVVLGEEMRSLFIPATEGYVFVGFDASGLENRVEASYCMRYRGGKEHAANILDGDPHTKNAFVFYADDIEAKFGLLTVPSEPEGLKALKEDPKFKPLRSRSKNGRYALSYGCSPAKLAKTLGFPESRGKELYDAFWDNNPALKELKDRLEQHWEGNGKAWIRGIDGRRIMTRSKHSLVNSLFQSCGSVVMEYAIAFLHKWLGPLTVDKAGRSGYDYKSTRVYRVGFFHDELLMECHPDVAEEIKEMGMRSIRKAGEFLKLAVPLDASGAIGTKYSDVH